MRSQWFIWALVAAVGIFVLVIFNYQDQHDSVSLSQIFPDQDREAKTDDVEYEFVDAPKEAVPTEAPQITKTDLTVPQKPVERQPEVAQAVTPVRPQEQPAASPAPAPREPIPVRRVPTAPAPQTVQNIPSVAAPASAKIQPTPQAVPSSDTVNAQFTIQVASFKDRESAEVTLKGMKAAGHPAYIVSKDLGAKGTWYRIYIGQYQTKEEANQKLSEIKPNYSNSFVISP